ncbi:hypothetical protein [Clostridium botulinum]|uniref:hypothetical protein n=3 Tax=Clostridium botulinum TaxID=1491 RepID=UPI001E56ACA0|nr:hypothetical protein [Clostridium botulinum]MCD3252359.1 hypothetical protein [Clostridium botulinum C/D]MCD3277977.1 hypothetical protein [Clostridium botulinum C/D]MCD3281508.1 hypothetical protein [Clostridium botulinum C/D]MCD3355903.1 hypothetical protein [Clostridium botulinum C/D]
MMILYVFGNILFGIAMLTVWLRLLDLDIPDEIAILGVILGVLVWIPYGMYKLIAYPIKKKSSIKTKKQQEINKIRNNVLSLCKYKEYYKITSNSGLQFQLKRCSQLYLKLRSYQEINALHNNRVEKVFISTVNYLLEIKKQCEEYDAEIEDKKKQIIDKLLNFLIKEEEAYCKEYTEMKNKDKEIIKTQLDKFNNTIDAYMEIEDIGKDD